MLRFAFLFVCVACIGSSQAADLGTYGHTYEIVEKDAIDLFKSEVAKGLSHGGKERMIAEAKQRFIDEMANIPPSKGVYVATTSRTRLEDLSERVNRDILDHDKNVIVPAGTILNPLKTHPLTKKVFFIDARVKAQLDFVKTFAGQRDKIILVAGNLWTTQDYLKRNVFLDMGTVKKMRIKAVPSIASQGENNKLRIEEVAL